MVIPAHDKKINKEFFSSNKNILDRGCVIPSLNISQSLTKGMKKETKTNRNPTRQRLYL
jgi:hypothetical protein